MNILLHFPMMHATEFLLDCCFNQVFGAAEFCGDDNEYFLCFGPLLPSRCYLHAGDLDRGHKVFEDFANSGRPAFIELYVVGVLVNNYMGAYEFQVGEGWYYQPINVICHIYYEDCWNRQ